MSKGGHTTHAPSDSEGGEHCWMRHPSIPSTVLWHIAFRSGLGGRLSNQEPVVPTGGGVSLIGLGLALIYRLAFGCKGLRVTGAVQRFRFGRHLGAGVKGSITVARLPVLATILLAIGSVFVAYEVTQMPSGEIAPSTVEQPSERSLTMRRILPSDLRVEFEVGD